MFKKLKEHNVINYNGQVFCQSNSADISCEGKHVRILKQQSEKQDSNESDSKTDNEKEELNSVEAQSACPITDMTSPKEIKTAKCPPNLNTNDKGETNLKETNQKLLLDNGIVTLECDIFSCKFCVRKFPSLHDTLLHIKGRSHVNTLKSQKTNSNTFASEHITHENSTVDIGVDKKLIINFSMSEANNNVSQKQNISTNIYNITPSVKLLTNNTYEREYLINDINESICNKMQEKNKNDIVLQNSYYHCELCNVQINMNNLFEHINTVTHKCNIFSMNMGDDIILYKCFCCKSILQGNSLLINHLRLETHLSNLASALKDVKMNNEVFVYTSHGTQNILEDNKFLLCNVLLPKVENTSIYFTGKCLIFFDLTNMKFYNDIKNNIVYHCSFCRAKLNTDHNLIEHCQGKLHIWRVKQLFSEKEHFNNNNTMSMSDQFSKMSITDKNSQSTNIFNNSIITNKLNTEVRKCLEASPFVKERNKFKRKETSLAVRLNKVYLKSDLEIEEEMYTLKKNKIDDIESSFKLLVPYNILNFYCLVCNIKISNDLNTLYEHVRHKQHKINVNKNTEKLLKQYMKQISKNSINCYPCCKIIQTQSQIIDSHISSKKHKKNHEKFCTIIDNTFKSILQNLNSVCYSIQRFLCTLCKTCFEHKIEFIKHVVKKHKLLLKNDIFDFCIPCATLWLTESDCYTEHCDDPMHKYLTKSKDFMIADLPECIKKILTQVDETVNILYQQSQVLLNDNIQEEVRQSLENNMRLHFPSVKAFLFGSRVTGLGFANSDVDVYLDCENTYYENKTKISNIKYLRQIEEVLRVETEMWEVKEILEETRTPIIKVIYKQRDIDCDISVTNGLSVENSKLIRSFNDAYPPCRKLILFIKKWLSLFNLPTKHGLSNYALSWIVIFYLQSELYLPSVAALIKERNKSEFICGWETGIAQPKSVNESKQSISALLLGFFKFYADFDYQHDVICPLMGYVIAKEAFSKIDTLPEEMKPYINQLKTSTNPEYFRTDSMLCVQDPFDLSHNLTKAVNNITLKYFKQYCQDSKSVLLSTRVN